MSSTCSVLPRDLISVAVAAEQVGAHPQTLLTRCTFPVLYPVLAPERGPRWQTHAQRAERGHPHLFGTGEWVAPIESRTEGHGREHRRSGWR